MAWLLRQTEVAPCVGGAINRLLSSLLTPPPMAPGYWLLLQAAGFCLLASIVFCLLHIVDIVSLKVWWQIIGC